MIPKLIYQMWIGPKMPDLWAAYHEQVKTLHADWTVVLLTDADILKGDWYNGPIIDNAEKVSPKAPYQLISDIVRYEVLNKTGGVWIDIDMDVQQPIDYLCQGEVAWMGWEVDRLWLNNAVMASCPRHPFLAEAVTSLAKNVDKHLVSAGNTVKTGPQYITPIALKHNVTAYPKEFFYPYLWNELDREGEEFPDAYMVHRWNNRRRNKK